MMTIFFSSAKLISLQALPLGASFTQEYFINTIRSDIVHESGQIFRRVHRGDLFVHIDNSMYHNDRKVTDELEVLKLDRVPHPPYSPDLTLCDFWLFDMLKQTIKDRVFQTIEEILDAIRHVWREVTLERLQSVL
jgi:histone-lysine N-methyltransferase SETMAR